MTCNLRAYSVLEAPVLAVWDGEGPLILGGAKDETSDVSDELQEEKRALAFLIYLALAQ